MGKGPRPMVRSQRDERRARLRRNQAGNSLSTSPDKSDGPATLTSKNTGTSSNSDGTSPEGVFGKTIFRANPPCVSEIILTAFGLTPISSRTFVNATAWAARAVSSVAITRVPFGRYPESTRTVRHTVRLSYYCWHRVNVQLMRRPRQFQAADIRSQTKRSGGLHCRPS